MSYGSDGTADTEKSRFQTTAGKPAGRPAGKSPRPPKAAKPAKRKKK